MHHAAHVLINLLINSNHPIIVYRFGMLVESDVLHVTDKGMFSQVHGMQVAEDDFYLFIFDHIMQRFGIPSANLMPNIGITLLQSHILRVDHSLWRKWTGIFDQSFLQTFRMEHTVIIHIHSCGNKDFQFTAVFLQIQQFVMSVANVALLIKNNIIYHIVNHFPKLQCD